MDKKRIYYYIDEFIVLLFCIIGVIISDAISLLKEGIEPTWDDLFTSWIRFVLSCILAVALYGILHTKIKFNDKNKPPLIKRIATALSMGMAWRTMIGVIK